MIKLKRISIILFCVLTICSKFAFANENIEHLNWQAIYDDIKANPEEYPLFLKTYHRCLDIEEICQMASCESAFTKRNEIISRMNQLIIRH